MTGREGDGAEDSSNDQEGTESSNDSASADSETEQRGSDSSTDRASADSAAEPVDGKDATAADRDEQIEELRAEIDRLERHVDDRTVHRDEIKGDLKRYVRRRVRRGHARGWGPYLVLGYGTAMTLGAYYFLGGGWAILAMVVIWLSTLGLYVLMLLVGLTFSIVGAPSKALDRVRDWRD